MVHPPMWTRSLSILTIVVAIFTTSSNGQTCANINPGQGAPVAAAGVQTRVVMNGLRSPRGVVFDTAGNLLVVEQGGGGIRYIKLTDNGGTNVCVASSKTLIADNTVISIQPFSKIQH